MGSIWAHLLLLDHNMNFVYACRSGENEELRYSIRSVKYFYPDSNIWVVGGRPRWYLGNYVEVNQDKNKHTNVLNNLLAICDSDKIPNGFVYMNDDFFILDQNNQINFYYDGTLEEKIKRYSETRGLNSYTKQLVNTKTKLNKLGFNFPLNYEMHTPMPIEKHKLKKCLKYKTSVLWRSMYGNMFNVGGIMMDDVKIYNNIKHNKGFTSTSEGLSFNILLNSGLLDQLNTPSPHENLMI